MTAPTPTKPILRRKPTPGEISFLMGWHGLLSGAFLVAYVTAEVSYAMHLFSGVVVLFALAVRLLVGLVAPSASPLALPTLIPPAAALPDLKQIQRMINGWMAMVLLLSIAAAALSGWLIHEIGFGDDLHEGLAEMTPMLIFAHIILAVMFHALKMAMPAASRK